MTSNNDNDSILGLFSTRATSHKPIDRASVLQKAGEKSGSGSEQPKSEANNAPALKTSQAPRGTITPSGTSSSMMKAPSRSTLSPLASTILREARRELGSDMDVQSGEDGVQIVSEQKIASAVDKVLKRRGESLDDIERANIIIHLQKDLMGWGVLQPLIDNKEVTDIHCYDYQTVVLQRGKVSETTGIHWPSHQAYVAFIDRLLLRLGKSLTTQQHTVDAAFPNGIRICAIHESVCGTRGPLLCLRVPRLMEASLDSLVSYQVAPPLIVNYLASAVRSCQATLMIAGETGTGKTTMMKCLATQFGGEESIVSVEDTPELNLNNPYFRSLVSRTANVEGVGEVTLQEHIKTTLRMTPTRVLLGEMRTPYAAEAFLESAQTGHVGMSTIHARNARETLVRLESLLGRAQKSVSIDIIRQQIALAVDIVIWLFREKGSGKPRIGEIVEVGHFVEGVIQVRPMFTLIKTGQNPVWRVDSWTSTFDEFLAEDGIFLGDSPQEISFGTVSPTPKAQR